MTTKEVTRLSAKDAQTVPIKVLADFYRRCKEAYYNSGTPLMSDDEFDRIEEIFQQRSPNHPELQISGSAPPNSEREIGHNQTKVKLPFWMGSQDKIYLGDHTAFRRWRKFVPDTQACIASVKLDGLSAILEIRADSVRLLSRGDGTYASDWTHHLQHMPQMGVPVQQVQEWLRSTNKPRTHRVVVRGEAIMSHSKYQTHQHSREWTSTARNVVSGLLNSKESDVEALRWVDIVCYEVVEPMGWSPTQQLVWLENKLFMTVSGSLGSRCNTSMLPVGFQLDDLEPLFWQCREHSPYATDGVVVTADKSFKRNTDGNPQYGFAFKIRVNDASQIAETEVEAVEWNIVRTGYLKPTIVLKPVEIGGVRVQRATGYHYKYILDNHIGKGARVQVRRCGDVIPNVTCVVKRATKTAYPPTGSYVLSDTGVDAIAKDPETFGTGTAYAAETIAHFFKVMKVSNMSAKTAAKFVEHGYTDPFSVLTVGHSKLQTWEGFAEKSSRLLVTDIHTKTVAASPLQWVLAGAVFGRGVGERKLKLLSAHVPQLFRTTEFSDSDTNVLRESLLKLEGFQTKTVNQLLSNRAKYLVFWRKVVEYLELAGVKDIPEWPSHSSRTTDIVPHTVPENDVGAGDLHGQVFCFTGFRDTQLKRRLEERGGVVEGSLTRTVTVLVRKDSRIEGDKVRKARERGILVLNRSDME